MASPSTITSLVRRLLTPAFLVSPLIALLLVPALFYGASSDRAAVAAHQAMMTSLSPQGDHMAISRDFVCATSDVEASSLEIKSVKVVGSNNQTSLTRVGFGHAKVTIHPELAGSAPKSGDEVGERVTAHLRQQDGSWCLHQIDVSPMKP